MLYRELKLPGHLIGIQTATSIYYRIYKGHNPVGGREQREEARLLVVIAADLNP